MSPATPPSILERAAARRWFSLCHSIPEIEMELWLPKPPTGQPIQASILRSASSSRLPVSAEGAERKLRNTINDASRTGGDPCIRPQPHRKLVDFAWRANH